MLLQNRGCYFSLDPHHVNRLEPKKRTRHTLIPAMATREGRPWALYGTMGGDGQPQLQTQVLVNLVDHGLDPAEAVARPRIRITPDGTHGERRGRLSRRPASIARRRPHGPAAARRATTRSDTRMRS